MATLYKLNERYQNILQVAEMMDEEQLEEALKDINDDIEHKAENYAKVIKELETHVDGLKREEKRLSDRRKSVQNNIKRMKENLENSMKLQGKTKFKTQLFSFNIQNNAPSLSVMDESNIPKRFFEEQKPKLNKTALKNYMKEHEDEEVEGVLLKQTESLRIR